MLTTQSQVRAAFWRDLDELSPDLSRRRKPGKRQNDQVPDIRVAWVDYVDMLARSGEISEKLAAEVTL
ncbi:MAG: hypothetical protein NUV51_10955 [Sulfuricaulis sp.]|nr:hypothetical protein [Sulfuricaulis sp.]